MDCSPPGSSVHGISRQEYRSRLLFPAPEDLPDPGIKPWSPALQEDSLPSEPPGKPLKVEVIKKKKKSRGNDSPGNLISKGGITVSGVPQDSFMFSNLLEGFSGLRSSYTHRFIEMKGHKTKSVKGIGCMGQSLEETRKKFSRVLSQWNHTGCP